MTISLNMADLLTKFPKTSRCKSNYIEVNQQVTILCLQALTGMLVAIHLTVCVLSRLTPSLRGDPDAGIAGSRMKIDPDVFVAMISYDKGGEPDSSGNGCDEQRYDLLKTT